MYAHGIGMNPLNPLLHDSGFRLQHIPKAWWNWPASEISGCVLHLHTRAAQGGKKQKKKKQRERKWNRCAKEIVMRLHNGSHTHMHKEQGRNEIKDGQTHRRKDTRVGTRISRPAHQKKIAFKNWIFEGYELWKRILFFRFLIL